MTKHMPRNEAWTPGERARILAKVVRHDQGCWEWTGATAQRGYGRYSYNRNGAVRGVPAHRAVYQLLVGPIPDGLHIDHLCRNTGCVNPEHLEPVTQAENNRRSWLYRKPAPPPPHGRLWRYSRYGCRCDLCREANRLAKAEQRRRYKARKQSLLSSS